MIEVALKEQVGVFGKLALGFRQRASEILGKRTSTVGMLITIDPPWRIGLVV